MRNYLWLLCAIVGMLSCKKTEQKTTSSTATVSVTVRDYVTGLPIPKVTMTLEWMSNFASYEGYFGSTDSVGHFQFTESRDREILFSKNGYYDARWSINNNVAPNPPAVTEWKVTLKPMKNIKVMGFVKDIVSNALDSVKITVGYSNTNSIGGGGGGNYLGTYSKPDGSFNFIAYIDKNYGYSIILTKTGYNEFVQQIDTTQTAQNFSIKMQKRN